MGCHWITKVAGVTNWLQIKHSWSCMLKRHRDYLCRWQWKVLLFSVSDNNDIPGPADKVCFLGCYPLRNNSAIVAMVVMRFQMESCTGNKDVGIMHCNPTLRQVPLLDILIDLICYLYLQIKLLSSQLKQRELKMCHWFRTIGQATEWTAPIDLLS